MQKRLALVLALHLSLLVTGLKAQGGKLSGYMFADAYWVAANHLERLEGQNGYWFRRIYFTYDNDIAEGFAVRLRTEMNSPGDFTSGGKLVPSAKDAYLRWTTGGHRIYLGLSPTPTFDVIETYWGYRSVEKTPVDLQKFGSSRDIGVSIHGQLDPENRMRYEVMVANGNGTSSESNKGKMLMFSLGAQMTDNVFVQGYVDWNDRPDHTDRFTVQGFLAYTGANHRIGAQFVNQTRQTGEGSPNRNLQIVSAFVVGKLGEKITGLARVDRNFDSNPEGASIDYLPFSPFARSTFLLGGIDYAAQQNVHVIPNIEFVFYDVESGDAPGADVIPRITFYYVWK